MADNSLLPTASGNETFANDDIGGVKHPRAKVGWGPDGTFNDTDVASGKPLPTQLRHSDGTIVTDNTGMKISSSQLAPNRTTAGAMSDGFQLIDVPSDGTAAQRPVAVAHGANPTAVAAGAKVARAANRAGIPFMIGGHPNVITTTAKIADADGAQTNAALVTVSSGAKIVVTAISAICDADNTGKVAVRIGFAAATLPSASASGAAGMLLEGKYSANGGNQKGNGSGILGVGADGEDLRFTCDDPVGGALYITASYYTIES